MIFVLIHSPLVGPLTWTLVAEHLRGRGLEVIVPTLQDTDYAGLSYWKRHAVSVAQALEKLGPDAQVVLVGHSGTGPLLPAIAQEIGRRVDAYVFVDAGIPRDGASRLDLMADVSPEAADRQRRFFAQGGTFPNWTDQDLAEDIPDTDLRRRFLAELHPRELDFWNEPMPVFAGWPDAPCAYIHITASYNASAAYAQSQGWPFHKMEGGHFVMLVDPTAVTNTLVELVKQATVVAEPGATTTTKGRNP